MIGVSSVDGRNHKNEGIDLMKLSLQIPKRGMS